MKDELAKIIVDLHYKARGESIDTQDLSFLFFSSRMSDILFAFIKGSIHPEYILKISQDQTKIEHIKKEYDILTGISRFSSGILHKTFPLPLYSGFIKGHFLLVEEACKGIPMVNFMYSRVNKCSHINNILRNVTDWIVELHRSSFVENIAIDDFLLEGWAAKTIKLFNDSHTLTAEENQFIMRLTQLKEVKMPVVSQHGDLSPYNMFCEKSGDALFIFDWEYAFLRGLPLVDLLNFLVISQSLISNSKRLAGRGVNLRSFFANIYNILPDRDDFLSAFYEDNWFSRVSRVSIKEYCNKVPLDKRALRAIFLLFILGHLYSKKDFLATFIERGDPIFISKL